MNLLDNDSITHIMIQIKRSKPGKNPTKHGIVLKGLKPLYQNTLKKHEFLKDVCDDDKFLNIMFSIVDKESFLSDISSIICELDIDVAIDVMENFGEEGKYQSTAIKVNYGY